jgi:hypothetical protein
VTQLRRGHDEDVTFAQMIYLPGIDRQTFEGVDERVLGAAGFPPDGCVFHVNGPYDGGHYVMDAWATQGHYDRFRDDHILPAIKAAGLEAAPRLEHLILHASLRQPAAAGAVA